MLVPEQMLKPLSASILWTWSDFFIVHFMEYNRDVDVGEQDINPPRLAF